MDMDTLVKSLTDSLDRYSKAKRDAASTWLLDNSGTPGLCALLIELISSESAEQPLRQSAAANLYSLIQRSWSPEDSPYQPIPVEDKQYVKSSLVDLMLSVPKYLFKSVSGSLQIVSAHEFPHNWPELMPALIERLGGDDPVIVTGILKTMSSVLKFYRNKPDTAGYVEDLVAILKDFAQPLIAVAEGYSAQFDQYQDNLEALNMLLNMMKLVFEIFLSLTHIELPQVFVDCLGFWMELLRKYLTYTTEEPSLCHGDDEFTSSPGNLTKVQTSVIRVLSLFVRKYDEDVEPYIQPLLEDVWNLLQRIGSLDTEVQLHYDTLVIEALAFLAFSISGSHHKMFSDPAMLSQICTSVVLPNIRFMPNSMEAFQFEAQEYIRGDLEGSDAHTRRRSAIDLVKNMRRYYEQDVSRIFFEIITQLLTDYAADPENQWHLKDQAIYLVIALATTSQTRAKGVVAVNELVPLAEFFQDSILPELEDISNLDARPVVKADCLRFAISFRRQLSAEHVGRLLPLLSTYITAPSTVVSSYSAIALDQLLAMRDGNVPRIPSSMIETHMQPLFETMFGRILNPPGGSKFESENPYIGAAIARLISSVGDAIVPLAKTCLSSLTGKLSMIYKNPSIASFVHCIFEGIAGIIGALVKAGRGDLCEEAETELLPAFNVIFEEEILDLTPYVYQLMAQLLEARQNDADALWARYGEQFLGLTTANHWERFANIPALTRLMCSYIRFAPTYVGESLTAILGVFKRVNELKTYERQSFTLMLDLMLSLDRNLWQPHVFGIFDLMFGRLKTSPTAGYQNQFIIFCSNICFAPQLGPAFLIESVNTVNPNLFPIVCNDIIVRHMGRSPAWKTVVIGLMCLITSEPFIQTYSTLFVTMLGATINLAVGNKNADDADNNGLHDVITLEEKQGAAGFAKLNFSGQADNIIIPTDIVPQQFLANKLGELSTNIRDTIPGLCAQLESSAGTALNDILETYQVTLS